MINFIKMLFTGKVEKPPTKGQLELLKKMGITKKIHSREKANSIIEKNLDELRTKSKVNKQEKEFDQFSRENTPPTEKQLDLLKKLKVDKAPATNLEASQIIEERLKDGEQARKIIEQENSYKDLSEFFQRKEQLEKIRSRKSDMDKDLDR